MESLILANEAAVAEIRKYARADDKNSKGWAPLKLDLATFLIELQTLPSRLPELYEKI
jgi:hypothetical protein